MTVPFYRPAIGEDEIAEVVACLRSGWLTTGPRTKQFEAAFAEYVGARHAVAVNSCTAALHLALEAAGVRRGDLVLVPTMTFAATAEVVRYFDAVPVFVDCEPQTSCMDPAAAAATLAAIAAEQPVAALKPPYGPVRALVPMHYGGQMADVDALAGLARAHGLAMVEDAAHALPAAYRAHAGAPWRNAGTTADITCFSFYANKCITTGEGGMAVTDDPAHAERMRIMSLHGMSRDAWRRYSGGSWAYDIVAPGFKYNLTDLAAAIGVHQLRRAGSLHAERSRLAQRYRAKLEPLGMLELPVELPNRRHAWHLYAVRMRAGAWRIDRAQLIEQLARGGVAASVHWMPLHLHPYYRATYGTGDGCFPVAEELWPRLLSLPIFPGMTDAEQDQVVDVLTRAAGQHEA